MSGDTKSGLRPPAPWDGPSKPREHPFGRRATDRLHPAQRMIAILRACGAAGDTWTETAFFAVMCRAFGEIGGYPVAAVCVEDPASAPALRVASLWQSGEIPRAGERAAKLEEPAIRDLVTRAVAQNQPVVTARADDRNGAAGWAAFPFPASAGLRGALVLATRSSFTNDEIRFAGALVNLTVVATDATRAVRHHALFLSIFPVAVFEADAAGNCTYISDWWQRLTGQTAVEARGRGWLELVHPEDRAQIVAALGKRPRDTAASIGYRIVTRAGEIRHVVVRTVAEFDADGAFRGVIGTVSDVTEQSETEKELEYARLIIEQSPVVLYRCRAAGDFPVIYVSKNVARFGYSVADALTGHLRFPDYIHEKDRPAVTGAMQRLMAGETDSFEMDYRIIAGDGSVRWIHDRAIPIRDESGRLIACQGMLVDITERKEQEERIVRLLTQDPLTGLMNRASFSKRLTEALANLARTGTSFAVHLLGLDHFKDINDTLGHEAGDALLCLVADRLTKALRVTDVIAHMGGDQFAILQSTLTETMTSGMVATRLLAEIAKPIPLKGHDIRITASIGIVICDSAGLEAGPVLRDVDAALNRAKDEGRNRFRVHTDEINQAVRERVTLLEELRRALDRDELVLYYQPQFDIRDGTICGVEALLRWQHPERGLLLPGKFIKIAEITGLIVPIGVKVLRGALRQMKAWLDLGVAPANMAMAINLSAVQFKTATIEGDVLKAIEDFDLPPERLEIEVTETVFMEILANGENALTRLQRRAIKVAIDDFGTGYSSLAYVKWLHGTRLKIAQEFVRDIPGDPISCAVVRAVVAMAREIGIDFIAEGVEHEDQREFLRDLGCYWVQGFLYARPMPAAAMTDLLRHRTALIAQAKLPALP